MPSLGNLWYTMGIKDLTDADLKKINDKLKNAGSELYLTPKLAKDINEILPKGLKLELDPKLNAVSNEALQKAVEGKVMKVEIAPLVTSLRKALRDATKDNPPEVEVGVQSAKLRKLIETVLNKQGFLINISTVNDNYTKVVQQKLNGTRYTVKIHADAKEITQSVQASLMQVQSRYFGLRVSRDILYRSIDEALGTHRFPINIVVQQDQARKAVQDALLRAQAMGKDQALAYQRMQTGELKAAQAELARLKAAQLGAASAAKAHATASIDLGGAMGSNIKIAGELGSAMASLYSIHAAKEFLSQVIEIGGELEHQKIAMDTIFGDKGKTNELFGQIKGLARQSPFGVMELTKSVKALSAYGVEYNEIYDTAKRLADISAATSVDINRLILAFGKTKSRGFLDGLEAKQFAYANIPIYEMVRKKLEELDGQAVTTADVMARMKKREIGFDIVKDVLWDITDPGGKFYDMQEALAGSVKTSWKLVRDNIELMFGEIAEGVVGDSLKSTAEILQGLTREWRTVGTVVGTAALGLGVYKVATIGLNQVMQQGTAKTYENLMAAKQRDAQRLRSKSLVMELSAAEKARVATVGQLTAKELRNAVANDTLTLSQVEQLYVTGKLNKAHILSLYHYGQIDKATAKAILSNNRFTISLKGMGMAMSSLGKAAKAFFLNPWTVGIAAISGLMVLWQRHSEQMDKAKEIGDNLFTKAEEGAKNLADVVRNLNPAAGSSRYGLTQDIEKLEQAIKDYSPTPIEDINKSLVDQDGHLRTLAERYDYLTERVQNLKKAYDAIDNRKFSDIAQGAIEDTGGNWGNLFLNDDLITNAADYTKALKTRKDNIVKYVGEYGREIADAMQRAREADTWFRLSTEGMQSYEEQLALLVENTDKFQVASSVFYREFGNEYQLTAGKIGNVADVKKTYDELVRDTELFVEKMNSRLKLAHINPAAMTDEQKAALQVSLKSILDQMEGAGDEAKAIIAAKWEEAWDIVLMEDKIGPAMQDRFRSLASKSMDAATNEAVMKLQYEGYEKLSKAEKALVDKLMSDAGDGVMTELGITNTEMQRYLLEHPLSQLITLSYASGNKPSELAGKLVSGKGYQGLSASTNNLINQWTKSNKVYEARNAAQQALQAAADELTAAKKAGVGIEEAQAEWDRVKDALVYLEWTDITTKDRKSNKEDASKKDPLAESIKQRFKDIKDAWSEFQKWSKTEGREAAATRIGESGLFSTLSADKIPQTIEDYRALVKGLEDELRQAGVKGTARESLLNDLLKQLLDIDKTVVDEQLKLALDKVTKEADRQLADWNLFDKIRKATGNKQLAMNLAFGIGVEGQTDYVQLMKDRFNAIAKAYGSTYTYDTATPELLQKEGIEEVQKAYKQTSDDIGKYHQKEREELADMVAQYRTTQEEIIKLTEEAEEKKRKIRESKDLSPVEKKQITAKIDADLNYEVFRKSGEYLKFFNAILSMTGDEAEKVGQKIKEALDDKLKSGQISAKDYCDEMEKIDKQLEKIRQKQKGFGGLGSFVKGGLQQMFKDRFEQAQSDYNAATQNFDTAKQQFDLFSKEGNEAGMQQAQSAMDAANAMKEGAASAMQGAQGAISTVAMIDTIVHGINDTVQGIKGSFDLIADMADSFGVDTSADTGWGAAGAFLDAFSQASQHATNAWDSLKSGNIDGVIQGVVGSVTSWFTVFNRWHDAKLQKQIERSKEATQIMQNQYDILEKQMANFLGNAAAMNTGVEGGAYGKQRQLMQGQLAELQKQRQAEADKKKSDDSVLTDYDRQIQELQISIRDFAVEAAKDLYGIDLNGWAEQLGDSLVDAFAAGEDAAKAFDSTVGDIMRDVTSKMISQDILAPMFGDLRRFLFGEDGTSGAFGSDFTLSPEDAAKMQEYIARIKNKGIPAAQELYDAIDSATGGLLSDSSASDSLREGIEGIKEDQADLLASYLNAVRADVSIQTTVHWPRLLDESLPQISVIAQSQLDCQRRIAEYARRNAEAAEAIQESTAKLVELNDQMGRSWRRIAERNWGYS